MKDITKFLKEQLEAAQANINEATVNEAEIKDEAAFREYAEKKLKEVHEDDYDEEKAKEMIDGILEDNKELVDENKWGELIGILNKGIAKED